MSENEEILVLKKKLSSGATRNCYIHPFDEKKCVKVISNPKKSPDLLLHEIKSYGS